MKKALALILALVMLVAIVGCSKTETAKTETKTETTETKTETTETKTEAAAWPTRPVNVTVAASAGGATDIIVRKYAEKFQEVTGQPMVITNISGATAYVTLAGAEPDGYNFGTMSTAFLTYKHQGMVDFTWDEAYEPAAVISASNSLGFVVRADSQFQTINDLVDYAKANPGKLTVGNGQGTPFYWQLAFQKATDTDIYTVHLGDTNELNVALLGGQVDAIASRYAAVKSYLDSGDFRMICSAREERSELAPEVPTCKESGIDFLFSPEIVAMMAPKGTPVEAREAMCKIFNQMNADPEFAAELNKLGQEVPGEYDLDKIITLISTSQTEILDVIELAEK